MMTMLTRERQRWYWVGGIMCELWERVGEGVGRFRHLPAAALSVSGLRTSLGHFFDHSILAAPYRTLLNCTRVLFYEIHVFFGRGRGLRGEGEVE